MTTNGTSATALAGAPKRLNARHTLMTHLVAAGLTDGEIAAKLGYSASRVSILKRSPLFQAEVAALQREIRDRLASDVADWIKAETPPTLVRLRELRDQDTSLAVSFSAVKEILTRAAPVVERHEVENVLRVAIDPATARRLAAVMAEDMGRDPADVLEALPLDDMGAPVVAAVGDGTVRALPLDDLVEEFALAAEEADAS